MLTIKPLVEYQSRYWGWQSAATRRGGLRHSAGCECKGNNITNWLGGGYWLITEHP